MQDLPLAMIQINMRPQRVCRLVVIRRPRRHAETARKNVPVRVRLGEEPARHAEAVLEDNVVLVAGQQRVPSVPALAPLRRVGDRLGEVDLQRHGLGAEHAEDADFGAEEGGSGGAGRFCFRGREDGDGVAGDGFGRWWCRWR